MKKIIFLTAFFVGASMFSQTIDFKGCTNLFDNQTYTFNITGNDVTGKNIYMTTPIDGQPCGGLGSCEFKIQWSSTHSRWDFLADSGNGDFVNPFLIYYSTTGNSSEVNPPNITIGTWVENTAITGGECGGTLTNANGVLTGDVRSTSLGITEKELSQIAIYPNPASDFITISGMKDVNSVKIYSLDGKLLLVEKKVDKINISKLSPGMYLLDAETSTTHHRLKLIKK